MLAKRGKTEEAVERNVGSGRPKSAAAAESIKKVSAMVEQGPPNDCSSVRKIAADRKLRKSPAFGIMKDEIRMTPLKEIVAQELEVQDKTKRLARASEWLRQIEAEYLGARKVIFRGEGKFNLRGAVGNIQNTRVRGLLGARKSSAPAEIIRSQPTLGSSVMVHFAAGSQVA